MVLAECMEVPVARKVDHKVDHKVAGPKVAKAGPKVAASRLDQADPHDPRLKSSHSFEYAAKNGQAILGLPVFMFE
jgi:hypothetical protein